MSSGGGGGGGGLSIILPKKACAAPNSMVLAQFRSKNGYSQPLHSNKREEWDESVLHCKKLTVDSLSVYVRRTRTWFNIIHICGVYALLIHQGIFKSSYCLSFKITDLHFIYLKWQTQASATRTLTAAIVIGSSAFVMFPRKAKDTKSQDFICRVHRRSLRLCSWRHHGSDNVISQSSRRSVLFGVFGLIYGS